MPPTAEPEAINGEDQPKPTSLKDRIALLQKQQLEQARRAEGALKKEKPKKPPKKHTEVEEPAEPSDIPSRPSMDRIDTMGKKSVDFADDESGPLRGHASRQVSVHPGLATPPQPSRELVSDTNDADDDTEEALDLSAEEERKGTRQASIGIHPTVQSPPRDGEAEAEEDGDGAGEEDAEEEDVDPEVRRRMEIRERMAKMSGGMGMMGIFGPAGGMPSASTARKPRQSNEESQRHASSGHGHEQTAARAPPVPIMALPGLSRTRSPEEDSGEMESDTEDPSSRATPRSAVVPAMPQEETDAPAPPKRSSTGRFVPPVPQGQSSNKAVELERS
jgi:myosin tail region-interacting protein MTI1